jgi:predicted esterase
VSAPAAEAFGFTYRFEPAVAGAQGEDLTILALHGTGGDEHDLVPLARALAPGAAVLSPRGQVLEGGAPRFFRRLREGVFDLADLAARTEALGDFVDGAADRHGIDRGRIVAVGFSNGANVAASLLLRRPGSLAGALLLRAMVPFEPETPPAPGAVRPVVTIAAGLMDPLVPREQAERLATLLRSAGAEATLELVPAGHQLTQRDLAIGQALLARLSGGPGARDAPRR